MTKIIIGNYQGTIYPEGSGYVGSIDLEPDGTGQRKRFRRRGKTKEAVKDKLKKFAAEQEVGIKSGKDADKYDVAEAVSDWLTKGTRNLGEGTVVGYQILSDKHLTPQIGAIKLKKLTADDVDEWLDGLTGKLSTRSLQAIHSVLRRAIRQAQVRDKVNRNVADLVDTPKGRPGRPSRALTLAQAKVVIERAGKSPLHAYVIIGLMTGIRTEEARALRWDHVVAWVNDPSGWQPVSAAGFDHKKFAIYVWRSVREGGDTKTEKSRRTLELPTKAASALRELHKRQAVDRLKAGTKWQDHGLVFCTRTGTPLNASNVRRSFRAITTAAGIGEHWTPRELRHSFVSIMSDHGVPIEKIADLVGHKNPTVTGRVYRHQLKPVIAEGATTMNTIFQQTAAKSA